MLHPDPTKTTGTLAFEIELDTEAKAQLARLYGHDMQSDDYVRAEFALALPRVGDEIELTPTTGEEIDRLHETTGETLYVVTRVRHTFQRTSSAEEVEGVREDRGQIPLVFVRPLWEGTPVPNVQRALGLPNPDVAFQPITRFLGAHLNAEPRMKGRIIGAVIKKAMKDDDTANVGDLQRWMRAHRFSGLDHVGRSMSVRLHDALKKGGAWDDSLLV